MRHTPRAAIVVALLLLAFNSSATAAPILQVVGGELMGATGVDVGGTLYDVAFVDGSCIGQFSGCDNASADFAFTTDSAAFDATLALLDQVFLDGPSGAFDSQPDLDQWVQRLRILPGMGSLFHRYLRGHGGCVDGRQRSRKCRGSAHAR